MNFYKRHLGDIAKACGHLSQGQIGAYDLLLDWLYGNEKPLPMDRAALHRIGRASTKAERENVDLVLAEFFTLTDAGYTQKRVAEEIAKANAQADTNRRIAEEREAAKRARREHESCTNRATNDQPSQTPDTRHQEATPASRQAPEIPQGQGTAAGLACRLMRDAGCVQTNPSHPDLLAALAEGVTPEALADTVREAVAGNVRKPFAYAITTARGRRAEGAKPITGANHESAHPGGAGRESLIERATRKAREHAQAGHLD